MRSKSFYCYDNLLVLIIISDYFTILICGIVIRITENSVQNNLQLLTSTYAFKT